MNYDDHLKEYLDFLYERYCTEKFIPADPISFPKRYENPRDIETIAFMISWISMGRRTKILESGDKLCTYLGESPFEKIAELDTTKTLEDLKDFSHFAYSTIHGSTVVVLLNWTKQIIQKYGSIKEAFLFHYQNSPTTKEAQTKLVDEFYSLDLPKGITEIERTVKSLLPNPAKGSACKRIQMFLRWLVRKDEVDFGIWSEIPTSELMIPLDAHVSTISRMLNLTSRKQDNWKTSEEITARLREFCPEDPIKYDFAIFGAGVSKERPFDNFLEEMREKGFF
ncbi:MAG: TIGR02757 family protein [Calditrichaeota bacterium]|nr:MAG: TIGR02757 family protein [Calditrichota bacterium]